MADNIGLPYVDPSDNEYATKTQANLSRAQWDDYVKRFEPYEAQLASMVGNEQTLSDSLNAANASATSSFESAKQGFGMNLAKYGTSQDATEKAATDRSFNLNKSATQAGLRNSVRTQAYDRDIELMTGAGNTISGMKNTEEQ